MSLANKDEAEKAEGIARKALRNKDQAKAIRFLRKAQKLYPSAGRASLLETLEAAGKAAPAAAAAKKARAAAAPVDAAPSYTDEQVELVKSKQRVKDFYQLLGVEKTAGGGDIKRAYKKLALKFHPDKNRAPGADEVFRRIAEAYTTLSDDQKRAHYDQFGPEEASRPGGGGGGGGGGYTYTRGGGAYYQDHMTPEDLFEMFFNGAGMRHHRRPRGAQQRYRTAHRYQSGAGGNPALGQLLHLLPVALFLLLAVLAHSGSDSSHFSLKPTSTHTVRRQTQGAKVAYYVSSSFQYRHARNPQALYHVEMQVEQTALHELKEECTQQRKARRDAIDKASALPADRRTKELRLAHAMSQKKCSALKSLKKRLR